MSLHNPATDRVADTLTRVGSGVAALMFVIAATLAVPALIAVLAWSALPTMLTAAEVETAAFTVALVFVALGASLGALALGRALRHH